MRWQIWRRALGRLLCVTLLLLGLAPGALPLGAAPVQDQQQPAPGGPATEPGETVVVPKKTPPAATVQPEEKKPEKKSDVHTRAAEDKLRLALGTRVRINRKGKGGRIEIDFVDEDELQRLYERLIGE